MGLVIVEGEGAVLMVNVGRPIVTSGDGNALFPNYFGEDLLLLLLLLYTDAQTQTGFIICPMLYHML